VIKNLPFVEDRNNSSNGCSELEEGRHGKVEVLERRIAPSAVVVGQRPIGRTQIGGRHSQPGCSWHAPLRFIAYQRVASSTPQAGVEKSRAQRCCVGSIACGVQIAISTCTTYKPTTSAPSTLAHSFMLKDLLNLGVRRLSLHNIPDQSSAVQLKNNSNCSRPSCNNWFDMITVELSSWEFCRR
jgi:hypothetical protein